MDPRVAHLLAFIEAEVTAMFRRCALDAAALAPNGNQQRETREAGAFDTTAERLERALSMVHLAVADTAVPSEVRDAVYSAALELFDWAPEFAALANAAAAARP